PGIPHVALPPDVALVAILPPLLYFTSAYPSETYHDCSACSSPSRFWPQRSSRAQPSSCVRASRAIAPSGGRARRRRRSPRRSPRSARSPSALRGEEHEEDDRETRLSRRERDRPRRVGGEQDR